MKWSLIAVSFFGFAQASFAAPISCGSAATQYSVSVSSDHKTATVRRLNQPTRFGNLICSVPASAFTNGPFLVCHSSGVTDDGYQAVLWIDAASAETKASLGKIWKGGTRPLGQLSCVSALHF